MDKNLVFVILIAGGIFIGVVGAFLNEIRIAQIGGLTAIFGMLITLALNAKDGIPDPESN